MPSYPGYPIYYRCKYCKRVFACGEDSLRYGGKPVPMEEAVAFVLAGRLNDSFDSCVGCCLDTTILHKGTDNYPIEGGRAHLTRG